MCRSDEKTTRLFKASRDEENESKGLDRRRLLFNDLMIRTKEKTRINREY